MSAVRKGKQRAVDPAPTKRRRKSTKAAAAPDTLDDLLAADQEDVKPDISATPARVTRSQATTGRKSAAADAKKTPARKRSGGKGVPPTPTVVRGVSTPKPPPSLRLGTYLAAHEPEPDSPGDDPLLVKGPTWAPRSTIRKRKRTSGASTAARKQRARDGDDDGVDVPPVPPLDDYLNEDTFAFARPAVEGGDEVRPAPQMLVPDDDEDEELEYVDGPLLQDDAALELPPPLEFARDVVRAEVEPAVEMNMLGELGDQAPDEEQLDEPAGMLDDQPLDYGDEDEPTLVEDEPAPIEDEPAPIDEPAPAPSAAPVVIDDDSDSSDGFEELPGPPVAPNEPIVLDDDDDDEVISPAHEQAALDDSTVVLAEGETMIEETVEVLDRSDDPTRISRSVTPWAGTGVAADDEAAKVLQGLTTPVIVEETVVVEEETVEVVVQPSRATAQAGLGIGSLFNSPAQRRLPSPFLAAAAERSLAPAPSVRQTARVPSPFLSAGEALRSPTPFALDQQQLGQGGLGVSLSGRRSLSPVRADVVARQTASPSLFARPLGSVSPRKVSPAIGPNDVFQAGPSSPSKGSLFGSPARPVGSPVLAATPQLASASPRQPSTPDQAALSSPRQHLRSPFKVEEYRPREPVPDAISPPETMERIARLSMEPSAFQLRQRERESSIAAAQNAQLEGLKAQLARVSRSPTRSPAVAFQPTPKLGDDQLPPTPPRQITRSPSSSGSPEALSAAAKGKGRMSLLAIAESPAEWAEDAAAAELTREVVEATLLSPSAMLSSPNTLSRLREITSAPRPRPSLFDRPASPSPLRRPVVEPSMPVVPERMGSSPSPSPSVESTPLRTPTRPRYSEIGLAVLDPDAETPESRRRSSLGDRQPTPRFLPDSDDEADTQEEIAVEVEVPLRDESPERSPRNAIVERRATPRRSVEAPAEDSSDTEDEEQIVEELVTPKTPSPVRGAPSPPRERTPSPPPVVQPTEAAPIPSPSHSPLGSPPPPRQLHQSPPVERQPAPMPEPNPPREVVRAPTSPLVDTEAPDTSLAGACTSSGALADESAELQRATSEPAATSAHQRAGPSKIPRPAVRPRNDIVQVLTAETRPQLVIRPRSPPRTIAAPPRSPSPQSGDDTVPEVALPARQPSPPPAPPVEVESSDSEPDIEPPLHRRMSGSFRRSSPRARSASLSRVDGPPVVEITSNDPRMAAKVAALLKLHHHFEAEPDEDGEVDAASELLREAEDEVASQVLDDGESLRHRSHSPFGRRRSSRSPYPAAVEDEPVERRRASSHPIVRQITPVPTAEDDFTLLGGSTDLREPQEPLGASWTKDDWRRLERLLRETKDVAERMGENEPTAEAMADMLLDSLGRTRDECADHWAWHKLVVRVSTLRQTRFRPRHSLPAPSPTGATVGGTTPIRQPHRIGSPDSSIAFSQYAGDLSRGLPPFITSTPNHVRAHRHQSAPAPAASYLRPPAPAFDRSFRPEQRLLPPSAKHIDVLGRIAGVPNLTAADLGLGLGPRVQPGAVRKIIERIEESERSFEDELGGGASAVVRGKRRSLDPAEASSSKRRALTAAI